jgi:hypothetical protein
MSENQILGGGIYTVNGNFTYDAPLTNLALIIKAWDNPFHS